LFKGARPTVTSTPAQISYGKSFVVQTPDAASISKIHIMRFGALTHGVNSSQVFYSAAFSRGAGILNVVAPPNGNHAPPGYYMLFAVSGAGVPSIAKITQIV
jgi:galactose oxidase